jgi:hypothetical protein
MKWAGLLAQMEKKEKCLQSFDWKTRSSNTTWKA